MNTKDRTPKYLKYKIIIAMLYILPVVFFVSVYFLQTVSSEDIYQGAGKPVAITQDILTIFRMLDVALAIGIFYLMTYVYFTS